MNHNGFESMFQTILIGLKYTKHKKHFFKEFQDVFLIIDLQKSKFSNEYYINLSFVLNDIPIITAVELTPDFFRRVTIVNNNIESGLINPLEYEEKELSKLIRAGIARIELPLTEGGIMKYLKTYPESLATATSRARQKLGIN